MTGTKLTNNIVTGHSEDDNNLTDNIMIYKIVIQHKYSER